MPGLDKEISNLELHKLVERWDHLMTQKVKLEQDVSDVNAEIAMVKDAAFKKMTASEAERMTFPQGTVYFRATTYPNILPGQEDSLIAWLDAQGPDGAAVAIREVKKTRLKEFIENQLETDGPMPPPEIVEIKPQKTIQLKRSKSAITKTNTQGDSL